MSRIFTNIFCLIIVLSASVSFAIDASTWENTWYVKSMMKKGITTTKMLENVVGNDVNNKKFVNKNNAKISFDKENNTAKIIFNKPYKDIKILSSYQVINDGSVTFGLNYTFNDRSMLLLDILGRYGSLCSVKTDEAMGRHIDIVIDRNTELTPGDPLASLLSPRLKDNEYIGLRFISPDRVHVTELQYLYVKNDDETEN